MTLALILIALAVWALHAAPVPTIGAAAMLAAAMHPTVTMAALPVLAVLAIAVGLIVIWRSLRDTNWRFLLIAGHVR